MIGGSPKFERGCLKSGEAAENGQRRTDVVHDVEDLLVTHLYTAPQVDDQFAERKFDITVPWVASE